MNENMERITGLNQGGSTSPQVAAAAMSPFHEVLVADVTESLPPEIPDRLRRTQSVDELHDWLAVGSMYRWIGSNPFNREQFFLALEADPKRAGLALARTMSARMDPPPRSREWIKCDIIGLLYQLSFLISILALRGVVLSILAKARGGDFVLPDLTQILDNILPLDLLTTGIPNGLWASLILAWASLWFGVEIFAGPRMMEFLRQWPAKRAHLPPPLSWRKDSLYALWITQILVLMLWACFLWVAGLLILSFNGAYPLMHRILAVALLMFISWGLFKLLRSKFLNSLKGLYGLGQLAELDGEHA